MKRLRWLAGLASVGLLAVPSAGQQPALTLVPAEFPPELRELVEQVGAVYTNHPEDASVLYQVAAAHARAGHTAQALAALERMHATGAGLNPRLRDGFAGLAGNEAFEALRTRIRNEHPPVRNARLAFEISEGDLKGEGIAWSDRTRTLYIGSAKRKIIAVKPEDGQVRTFVAPAAHGLGATLGLRVDDGRGELWAVSGSRGEPAEGTVTGVFRFRLSDGQLIRAYPIPGSHKDLLNDLAVAPDGRVYVTATITGALLRIDPESGRVDTFLPPGALPDPNGITIGASGRYAFVAGWYGITRVDLGTGERLTLPKPRNVADGCIDGLYLLGTHELIGVQNCVHDPGRIVRLRLSPQLDRLESLTVLESSHPWFDFVTTAAVAGRRLFFSANTQFLRPSGPFDPVRVLVLDLY